MQDFTRLQVWQKSHALTLSVYRATATYPQAERFGLTSQMRRAAASMAANIAEGCGRSTNTELRQFLHVAAGSANELIYFLLLSRDLGLLVPKQFEILDQSATGVKQMLTRLIARVEATFTGAARSRPNGELRVSDGKR